MSRRRRRRARHEEVNVMPVMNLFLILIPFLLLTAVFAQTAVFDLSLPEGQSATTEAAPPDTTQEDDVMLVVGVTDEGFFVSAGDTISNFLEVKDDQYNYPGLESLLRNLSVQFPREDEIVIVPEDNIKYDVLVQVMDQCLLVGFEEISFSEGIR